MLITAGLYVFSLFGALCGHIALFSFIISAVLIYLIIKEYCPIKYAVIWTAIFYLGIANTSLRLRSIDDLLNLAPINSKITGTIVSIPQGFNENKPKFFFEVNEINFGSVKKKLKNEKVLVTVNSFPDKPVSFDGLKIYNSMTLTGRLSTPFKAGNPSQFDYGNYLRNHNTYAVFYANGIDLLDKPLSGRAKLLQEINDYRERVLSVHSKYLPSPNLEILGGIVFGDDAVSPPKEIKQSFVNSGLLHILAASGMNVAFIYAFFYFLTSMLRVPFKIRVSLGMVMVVIYSLMTGLGASVIRAAGMLLFVLAGKLIDRDTHSISLLSFVALLMLLYNPLWINDVGFQLSFVVTFGLLLMMPLFTKAENKILDFIISSVTVPIIAQLWVIPIQIFYFNNISLYSVFANIMSVPILMVLSFGGFISALLSAITPISNLICQIFDFVLNPMITLLVNISDFWGKLPNSAIQTTHPSVFQIGLYYGILLCTVGLLYKEIREKYLKKLLIGLSVLSVILALTLIPVKSHNLEVTTFDVGNADCFLIKTPSNEYLMIDTGKAGYNGGKSQAEIIVLKYFKDIGIKNIDSIIITHFDNDHCGGTVDLLNNLKVNKLFVNDLKHESNSAKEIYRVSKNKTKLILAENKQTVYNKDGLKITNFITTDNKYDNDNSVITLLEYKDFTMLFTGDAGVNSLNKVIDNLPRNITVLKAPHHGAAGGINKEITEYLNPLYSVISTGENKFGHPSIYTLKLLKNTNILRTDIDNSIRFSVSDKGLLVLTYDAKQKKYTK